MTKLEQAQSDVAKLLSIKQDLADALELNLREQERTSIHFAGSIIDTPGMIAARAALKRAGR
jgi:hypothetical protein